MNGEDQIARLASVWGWASMASDAKSTSLRRARWDSHLERSRGSLELDFNFSTTDGQGETDRHLALNVAALDHGRTSPPGPT